MRGFGTFFSGWSPSFQLTTFTKGGRCAIFRCLTPFARAPLRPLARSPMWLLSSASAFHPPAANLAYRPRHASGLTPRMEAPGGDLSRRQTTALALAALAGSPAIARADSYAYQPALAGKDYGKSEMGGGADFIKTPSGLSYKDGTVGRGKTPAPGDRVVIDWTGYTARQHGSNQCGRLTVPVDRQACC